MPTWSEASERQLLLSIIHLTMPKQPDWDQVAVMVAGGVSASGCRQHFNIMRKKCKEEFGEPGTPPVGEAGKGTPRGKAGVASPMKTPIKSAATPVTTPNKESSKSTKTQTPSQLAAKRKANAMEDDVDDAETDLPSKKNIKKEVEEEEA